MDLLTVVDRTFTDEQGRTLTQYLANAKDLRDVRITVETNYEVTLSNSVFVEVDLNHLFLPIGQTWESKGIIAGVGISGTIIYYDSGGGSHSSVVPGGTVVDHVNGNTLVLSNNMPYTPPVQPFTAGALVFDITPEAFEFYENFVQANTPGNEFSLIDAEVNRYFVNGVDSLAVGVGNLAFNRLGNGSGGSNTSPTIQRITNLNGRKRFMIYFSNRNYMWMNDEVFEGENCVKPWYKLSAISQANNPAAKITAICTYTTGNTGKTGESFNGNAINYYSGGLVAGTYFISAINFSVNGNIVSVPDHTETTDFEITVDGKFSASSKFGISFFRSPDESEYKNQPNTISQNTSLCIEDNLPVGSLPNVIGLLNSSGAGVNITDFEISQSGTSATFTGKLVPNAVYTAYVENPLHDSKRIKIEVKVEDYSLTGDNIQPGWLLVFEGETEKFLPPLGSYDDFVDQNFVDHNGETPDMFTEDDLLIDWTYRIPKNVGGVRQVTGAIARIVAKNGSEFFDLDKYLIPWAPYADLNDGSIDVNYSSQRAYNMPPSSDKKTVSMKRINVIGLPSDRFAVQLKYGFVLRWEYWLDQLNASSDFQDSKNKDWFHYQDLGWSVEIRIELVTPNGNYVNSGTLLHKTYDDSEVESVFKFFKMDGTPISGPLSNETTVVQAEHTAPDSALWQDATVWGAITAEPKESQPRDIISTVLPHGGVPSNSLQPQSGYPQASITINFDKVIVESLFNPLVMDVSNGVKFTARIKGQARKGEVYTVYQNRTKEEFVLTKSPKQFISDSRTINDCCEKRKVVASLSSLDPYQNDITGHPMAGETVVFKLFKGSVDTGYVIQSIPFIQQANMWGCQLNWRDILNLYGAGCFQLKADTEYVGLEETVTIETYELFRFDAQNTVLDEVRIMSVFNSLDVKNGIDYTGLNLIDSIRVPGMFGYNQSNTEVNNYTKTNYEQNSITRRDRDTYELRTEPISDKFVKILRYHLLHENVCKISDYCLTNPRFDYKDFDVIVSETMSIEYRQGAGRKVPVTAKFEDKVINAISSFNNNNPESGSFNITFANSGFVTLNFYEDGVLVGTEVVSTAGDETINIFQ
jgi:hypothetical protein